MDWHQSRGCLLVALWSKNGRGVFNSKTAERLKENLGDLLLASIESADLQMILAPPGSGGAAVLGRIRNARAFWRWAAKRGVVRFGGIYSN